MPQPLGVKKVGAEFDGEPANDEDYYNGLGVKAGPEPQVEKLRVLYLFAGGLKEKGFEGWIFELAAGREVEVDAYDIVRNRRHDLSRPRLRRKILADVKAKKYYFVAASPRVKHSHGQGVRKGLGRRR